MLAPAFKPGSDPERTPDGAAAGRVASDVAAVDALEAADDQDQRAGAAWSRAKRPEPFEGHICDPVSRLGRHA